MPISPCIRRLREHVGHDLLLVPSVAVLPRDEAGRILLVRQADDGRWARADDDETTEVGWFTPEGVHQLDDLGDFARLTFEHLGLGDGGQR